MVVISVKYQVIKRIPVRTLLYFFTRIFIFNFIGTDAPPKKGHGLINYLPRCSYHLLYTVPKYLKIMCMYLIRTCSYVRTASRALKVTCVYHMTVRRDCACIWMCTSLRFHHAHLFSLYLPFCACLCLCFIFVIYSL